MSGSSQIFSPPYPILQPWLAAVTQIPGFRSLPSLIMSQPGNGASSHLAGCLRGQSRRALLPKSFPPCISFPLQLPYSLDAKYCQVTGPDSISVHTYSILRVYVLFLFVVGMLSSWWCSSMLLCNGFSVRHCRTQSLGSRRVWTLFFVLFQALLAIAILLQIQPCVRQDRCTCRGLVVHSTAVIWIEGIPLQTSDGY